jgi:hypothetical protein
MRLPLSAACAAAALAVAFAAAPARGGDGKSAGFEADGAYAHELSAQNRRRARTAQRGRPRITVRRRSYLDAGTEVFPGSMGYTDYAFPLGYTGYSNVDPTGASRWPLPGPFELRSYHAPSFGY